MDAKTTCDRMDERNPWAVVWNTSQWKGEIVRFAGKSKDYVCMAIFRTREEAERFAEGVREWDLVRIRLTVDGTREPAPRTALPARLCFAGARANPSPWIN